ncbi:MAG TPA: hypothetical protein VFT43_06100 [Candidatus Polarisedimenticolia bacterium]|nr:hypothetical protein [Candidatus Polarisedimenticolia bacterium]
MTDRRETDDYFRAIEEEFARRRGAPLLLSPRDWALVGDWQRDGIPLRIVLQAMANVFEAFERRRPAGRRINSLSYCRQEVLALNDLYRSLRAAEAGRPDEGGAGAPAGLSPVARHLGRLLRRVRDGMANASEARLDPLVGALAQAAAALKVLRRETKSRPGDPHALEEELRRLDATLLDAARTALPADEIRDLEGVAERDLLAAGSRMGVEAHAATRRTVVANALRRRCRIPRLTLFD